MTKARGTRTRTADAIGGGKDHLSGISSALWETFPSILTQSISFEVEMASKQCKISHVAKNFKCVTDSNFKPSKTCHIIG